jgi:hypothetical protein
VEDDGVAPRYSISARRAAALREHQGGVVRIREDGSLEREIICDRTAMVTRETAAADYHVSRAGQKWLKPGVVFSSTDGDVIAIWPSKGAKLPSIVLGGVVK